MIETSAVKFQSRQWEIDVPIVTDPFMLLSMAKVFVVAGSVMWGLLAFLSAVQGEWKMIAPMGGFVAAIIGGVMLCYLVGSLLIYRNRIHYRFTVDDKAARAELIDRRVKGVNRLGLWLGVLSGKPGVAGAGLIARSQEIQAATWKSIVRVTPHPRLKAISLGNAWRTTLILYCTPENYDAVLAAVQAAHAAHPARVRANPLPRLLLHTVLVMVASIPLFNLPAEIDRLAPFMVLCFALASVWLLPFLVVVVIGGLAWIAIDEGIKLFAPFRSMISGDLIRRIDILGGDGIAAMVLASLGAAYLLWLSFALLTGRVSSALAGDMTDMADASK